MTPFTLIFLFFSSITWAENPAFHNVDLAGLVSQSDLIMTGWPSPHKQKSACGEPLGIWQINYVIKGDQSFRHKVISIYGPSPEALDKEKRSTILFLKKEGDCWKLVTEGAQEELAKEQFIRSLVNPTDCRAQTEAIRVALNGLPQECTSNEDCQGMTLHPRSCERPRAFNIKAEKMLPPEWPALAARARAACSAQWGMDSACASWNTDAYCKEGHCRLGTIPPANPSFTKASMIESCAPHDAGSMALTFMPALDKTFPRLSINWWGDDQPSRKPGTYTLSNGFGGKASHGFSSSYCSSEGHCTIIKEIFVKIHVSDDGEGEAEAEGITFDGASIKTNAPLKVLPKQQGLRCG